MCCLLLGRHPNTAEWWTTSLLLCGALWGWWSLFRIQALGERVSAFTTSSSLSQLVSSLFSHPCLTQTSGYCVQTKLISVSSTWLHRKPGGHNGSVTFLLTQKVTTCHCKRKSSKTFSSGIGQASLPCFGNGGVISLQGRAGLHLTKQFLGAPGLVLW